MPFFICSTVRVSHTKSLVEPGERREAEPASYESNAAKWVMMPAFAKPRRVQLKRDADLRAFADECAFNRLELKGTAIGVICAGAVYQHVVEGLFLTPAS